MQQSAVSEADDDSLAPPRLLPRKAPRPPWIVWLGLAVVLAAAAALSFDALRSLALAVGIPPRFAWLLPVSVDAGAAVSCAVWLGGRTTETAARFAGRMTRWLAIVTVLGNAGALAMHHYGIDPPWWVAALVGAIPPSIVVASVHLVVLLTRAGDAHQDRQEAARPGAETPGELAELPALDDGAADEWVDPWERWAGGESPGGDHLATAGDEVSGHHQDRQDGRQDTEHDGDELTARARELVAAGAGRPRLMRELAITDHQARKLLEHLGPEVGGVAAATES